MATPSVAPDDYHIQASEDGRPADDIKPISEPSRFSWAGMKKDITKDHTDIPIIACCFASGLCDSSAFNAWNTFVSMQTGESLFISQ